MSYLVVGCSYRTAPLALRERLAFSREEIPPALAEIAALPDVEECMLLGTCNRVEVYAAVSDPAGAETQIQLFLARSRAVDPSELEPVLQSRRGDDAVLHIFRVASSLDAMVVGEAQVAGQVKDAFAAARAAGTVGPRLAQCLSRAFSVAKRVRSQTGVARHPASVSSVAVDLAARIFADLGEVSVLVIGAGEMAELALRHLVTSGARRLRVTSRTAAHAEALAGRFGARTVPLEALADQLAWADVVITSTGSDRPIIGRQAMADVMRRRKQRPVFIVDIAVPRDVAREVAELANVYLYALDDLEQVVQDNLRARRKEAKRGERMVAAEVQAFAHWRRQQGAVPLVKALRQRFTEVAGAEVDRAARKLGINGDARKREALERMAGAIVNKLLHAPTQELKRVAGGEAEEELVEAARRLFQLDEPGGAQDGE